MREGLIRLAQSAGLNPMREARFLLPGLDRRPADLLIPFAGTNGQDLCLDVTVTAALKRDSIERELRSLATRPRRPTGGRRTRWEKQFELPG